MTINKIKYKITTWSLSNLMSDTPAMIVRLQVLWVGIITSLGSSDYLLSDERHTSLILFIGGIVDKVILGGLGVKEYVEKS